MKNIKLIEYKYRDDNVHKYVLNITFSKHKVFRIKCVVENTLDGIMFRKFERVVEPWDDTISFNEMKEVMNKAYNYIVKTLSPAQHEVSGGTVVYEVKGE